MTEFGRTDDKVIIAGGGFGALSAAVALHKVSDLHTLQIDMLEVSRMKGCKLVVSGIQYQEENDVQSS
jgi:NADH dehydrogenase FAD-containing subunit